MHRLQSATQEPGVISQTITMSGVQKTSGALGKVSGAVKGNRLTLKELMTGGGWRIVHDGNLL